MRLQISLSRFLLLFALAAVIIGIATSYFRHLQEIAEIVTLVHKSGGRVDQDSGSFLLLPAMRIVGVDLSGPDEPIDQELLHRLSRIQGLRRLRLNERPLTPKNLQAIASITRLEELSLCGTNVGDADVQQLGTLTQLRTIDLAQCNLTDECLADIQKLVSLESLCIAATSVSLEGLSQIRIDALRVIDASYCPGATVDFSRAGFGGLPNLEALSIRGASASSINLRPGDSMRSLRSLDIRATSIGIEGLADVTPRLAQIGVEPRRLTMPSLQELMQFVSLELVVVSTDYQILFIDFDGFAETEGVSIRGEEIQVPVTIREEAKQSLAALVESRSGLKLNSNDALTGNIYDRRRVYGGGGDPNAVGGVF